MIENNFKAYAVTSPSKPIRMPVSCSLCQTSIEDALCLLGFEPLSKGYLLKLTVNDRGALEAAKVAEWLLGTFRNIAIYVIVDEKVKGDSWYLQDIETRKMVWSDF